MTPLVDVAVIVGATLTSTAAITAAGYARAGFKRGGKAIRLLEGEAGQPGVLGRIDELEEDVEHLETTVDVVSSGARTDGGKP